MQGHAIEECNTSKHGDFNHGLVMVDIVQKASRRSCCLYLCIVNVPRYIDSALEHWRVLSQYHSLSHITQMHLQDIAPPRPLSYGHSHVIHIYLQILPLQISMTKE